VRPLCGIDNYAADTLRSTFDVDYPRCEILFCVASADSNVLMPRDYIDRLFASWRADTGLVASPPIGCRPQGLWAEIECAFLNTYQARWQYLADALGFGFAQGKTMLWRRADLERAGGIAALAREVG
jgi:ceramide glucosyltransferase